MTGLEHLRRRVFLQRALLGGVALASPYSGMIASAFAQPSGAAARLAEGAPSLTAQGAAVMRALHQVIDYPRVLDDPLAVSIIGAEGARALQPAADRQEHGLRAFIALRSRYAEDRLAAAVERGVRQSRGARCRPGHLCLSQPARGTRPQGIRGGPSRDPALEARSLAAAGIPLPPSSQLRAC